MITLLGDNSFQTNDYAEHVHQNNNDNMDGVLPLQTKLSLLKGPLQMPPPPPRSLSPLTNLSSLSFATLIGTDTSEGFRTRSVTSVTVFLIQWLMARDFLFRTVEATDFGG